MGKGKHRVDLPALTVEELVAILREDPARAVAAVAASRVLGPRVRGSDVARYQHDRSSPRVPFDSHRQTLGGRPVAHVFITSTDHYDTGGYGASPGLEPAHIPPEPLGDDPEAALRRIEDAVDAAWRAAGWVLA